MIKTITLCSSNITQSLTANTFLWLVFIPEVSRILDGGITKLNAGGATLLECLLEEKWFKDWVQLLSNILQ